MADVMMMINNNDNFGGGGGNISGGNIGQGMDGGEFIERPKIFMEDVDIPSANHNDMPIPAPQFQETKKMLPAEDLINMADLDLLANPDKLVPENNTSGIASTTNKIEIEPEVEERPVKAAMPPAPSVARRRQQSMNTTTQRQQQQQQQQQTVPDMSRSDRRQTPWDDKNNFRAEPPRKQVFYASSRNTDKNRHLYEQQQQYDEPIYYYDTKRQRYVDDRDRDRERDIDRNSGYDRNAYRDFGNVGNVGRNSRSFYDNNNNTRTDRRPGPSQQSQQSRNKGYQLQSPSIPHVRRPPSIPTVPQEPQLPPEEIQRRRKEEENKEKIQLLHQLFKFEKRGYLVPQYNMESNIDELRFEVAKIKGEENAKRNVKYYKAFLMIVVTSVETLNRKFDPFGFKLNGWSKEMNREKENLDECFHRLHDKWASKSGSIEPELELAFAFFGGGLMYHLKHTTEDMGEFGTIINAAVGGVAGTSSSSGNSNMNMKQQQQQQYTATNVVRQPYQQSPMNTAGPMNMYGQNFMVNNPNIVTNIPFQQQPQQQSQQPQMPNPINNPATNVSNNNGRQRRVMKPPMMAGGMEMLNAVSNLNSIAAEEAQDDIDMPVNVNEPPPQTGLVSSSRLMNRPNLTPKHQPQQPPAAPTQVNDDVMTIKIPGKASTKKIPPKKSATKTAPAKSAIVRQSEPPIRKAAGNVINLTE